MKLTKQQYSPNGSSSLLSIHSSPYANSLNRPRSNDRPGDEIFGMTHLAHAEPHDKHEAVNLLDPSAPRRRGLCSRAITDWWLLEIFCWLCAVGFTCGIAYILMKYHQSRIAEWPYSIITINSMIALFTTLAKGLLMIPVASCISQLKWAGFIKKERKLIDLQTFDDASRGVLGCLELLVRRKGGFFVLLGALTTVFAIAASTATQQIITTTVIAMPSSNVSLQRCQEFSLVTMEGGEDISYEGDSLIIGAVNQAIWVPENKSMEVVEPDCPTGNCTWNPFNSLSVCASQAADVTSLIPLTDDDFPNGFGSPIYSPVQIALVFPSNAGALGEILEYTAGSSKGFPDVQYPLADIYFLLEINGMAVAIEFILQLCVQNFAVRTTNANTTTILRGDPVFNSSFVVPEHYSSDLSDNLNMTITLPGDGTQYSMDWMSYIFVQYWLSLSFKGILDSLSNPLSEVLDLDSTGPDVDLDSLTAWMDNLAISLTNVMRENNATQFQPGIAYTNEAIFTVRWLWGIYLIGLLLLSAVVLIATILQSSHLHLPIWRSSVDVLLRVLEKDQTLQAGFTGSPSSMQGRSKQMTVVLDKIDGRWKMT